MSAVLFMMGTSRGGALNGILSAASQAFKAYGLEVIPVDLRSPNLLQDLDAQMQSKDVRFALGIIGIGRDLKVRAADGKELLAWDMIDVPFISVNGDSPAYYYDRHVNPSANYGALYTFREHYEFRKALPKPEGLFGLAPPMIFDKATTPFDGEAKARGTLVFLKNGGNPAALKAIWKERCNSFQYQTLCDVADVLAGNIAEDPHPNIDALICAYFKSKGLDADEMLNVRLFFVAQLDDYLRRVKCVFMLDVLKDFPVEIHGDNWEFGDFSNSKMKLVPVCNYEKSRGIIDQSLGIIDFSPNTGGGFHDRPLRAFGHNTLCLTNRQECFSDVFGADNGFSFDFSRESLADKIADVLAHPKHYIEMGLETARVFNEQFSSEAAVHTYVEAAELIRMHKSRANLGIADYFVWPPQMA